MPEIGDTGTQKSTGKRVVYTENGWMPLEDAPGGGGASDGGNFFWQKGEIDTPGERLGADIGKAIGSGANRGIAGLAALDPRAVLGSVHNVGESWMRDLLGMEQLEEPRFEGMGGRYDQAMNALDMISGATSVDDTAGDYEPETTAGRYAQQIAEFAPGAILPGGQGLGFVKNVVAPAVVSQGVSDALEGSQWQDEAEIAAAVATPYALSGTASTIVGGAASKTRQAAAERLRKAGAKPTAGMVSDSPQLQAAEYATPQGRRMMEESYRSYTTAAMNKAGEGNKYVTFDFPTDASPTDQMDIIFDTIGSTMDDLATRNSMDITPAFKGKLKDARDTYNINVTSGNRVQTFDWLMNQIDRLDAVGLSGEGFQYYRTQLNNIARTAGLDGDTATVDAARAVIDAMDEAMDASIRANANKPKPSGVRQIGTGDVSDADRYREARDAYRKALILERALNSGQHANIMPGHLRTAERALEKRGLARGKAVFSDLIEDGTEIYGAQAMFTSPTAQQTGFSGAGDAITAAAPVAAAGQAMGADPMTSLAAAAAAGIVAPKVRNASVAQDWLQSLLERRVSQPPVPVTPGAISIFNQ